MEAVPQPADPVRSAHARRNPTPWNKGGATARENSPYRSHIAPLAGQNSPCSHKMAQFGRFYPCRANFIPISPATSRAGRRISRTGRRNMARLKPTTPLLTPNKGPLKLPSPLHPKTAPNTPISHPQRRSRFQSHTGTSKQRRSWFQTTGPPRLQHPHAAPVGGGRAWPGFEATRRAKLAARTARGRAAAHRHTQRPGTTGVEGAGGPDCGGRGRRRGLADTTQHRRRRRCGGRRRVRRARAGFEIDHSEPSGSRVAISRAAGPSGARNTRGATSTLAQ